MKTISPVLFIFPRMFTVREGKVALQQVVPFGDRYVPLLSRTHASHGPLWAKMQVWSELIHAGKHDPIGRDRLCVHVALSLSSVWMRRSAEELLHTICESAEEFHLWLVSMQKALIAANHLVRLPRFPDETIRFVFAPLFDTVAALNNSLDAAAEERRRLWEQAVEEGTVAESLHQARFRIKFP